MKGLKEKVKGVKAKKYILQIMRIMIFFYVVRQLRIEYEGAFYHVASRGNQREKIFWNDKEREEFKSILKRTKERYSYLPSLTK